MQPQIALAVRPVEEPRMERWTSLSPRLVAKSELCFTSDFFAWLRRQYLWIEDFPYADVDFRGSMDLILPAGEDWDASGERLSNTLSSFFVLSFLTYIYFFGYVEEFLMDALFSTCRQGSSAPS
jgi:hypothetical protein